MVKQDYKAHYGDERFWALLAPQKCRAPTAIESGQAWNHEVKNSRLSHGVEY